jgi:hypothetical protein
MGFTDTWRYASVHPAAAATFGAGCGGAAALPKLAIERLPWAGDDLAVGVTGLPSGSPASLLVGASRTNWNGVPLPFDLGAIGLPGCLLWVSVDAVAPVKGTPGSAHWSAPIPNDPRLYGVDVFVQAVALASKRGALGAALSNAGAARIGAR